MHRYSFEGDSEVVDSVGGKDGSFHGGAKLKGTGYLDLDGVASSIPSSLTKLVVLPLRLGRFGRDPQFKLAESISLFRVGSQVPLLDASYWNGLKHVRFGISSGGSEKRVDGLDQLKGDGSQVNYLTRIRWRVRPDELLPRWRISENCFYNS